MSNWERIGNVGEGIRHAYGLRGKEEVIWIDPWAVGNYAIVIGTERKDRYDEVSVYTNAGNMVDAIRIQREYMKEHPNGTLEDK